MQYSTPKSHSRMAPSVGIQSPGALSFSTPKRTFVEGPENEHNLSTVKRSFENDFDERPYLPDCWLEDKRMEVLFSPFRVRDTNPDGWDLKMNFWVNVINKWCRMTRRIVFTFDDIRTAFHRGDQQPSYECIKLVISQMKRNQKILLEDNLPTRNQKTLTKKAVDWTINSLLLKPFSLGMSLFSREEISEEEKVLPNLTTETQFFNKDTMDILVESAEKWIKTLKTACTRYEALFKMINEKLFYEQTIEIDTFDVIVEILESKALLKTAEESGIKIIKYGKDCQIQPTDISVVKLEASKELLESECAKLEVEMEKLQKDARAALENKNRDKAMLILKKKKRLEKKLNEKDMQIDNIELLYHQILDTHSQQALLDALKVANGVLKQNSMAAEDVENTVMQVEETLDDISALNAELNRPLSNSAGSELEAEEELNELLKDIEDEKAAEKAAQAEKESALLQHLTDMTIIDSDLSSNSNLISKSPEPELDAEPKSNENLIPEPVAAE